MVLSDYGLAELPNITLEFCASKEINMRKKDSWLQTPSSGGGGGDFSDPNSPLSAEDGTSFDAELSGLVGKLNDYARLVDERIAQARDMLETPSPTLSQNARNDIKKNVMIFYSLKFVLETISVRLSAEHGSWHVASPAPSKEEMDSLISQYGLHPEANHFGNSLTRVYLVHLPRIIDKFLRVSSSNGFDFPKKRLAEEALLRKDEGERSGDEGSSKQLEVEDKVQFVMNLLVVFNSIKVNRFYVRSEKTDPYHYDFDPYDIGEFSDRPPEFGTANVQGNNISQLDELWMKNNYSNISQYVTYLLCDILQVDNLNYQGPRSASASASDGRVTTEDLCTNPGYPYTLKALNLGAIRSFKARGVDFERLEGRLVRVEEQGAEEEPIPAPRSQSFDSDPYDRSLESLRVLSSSPAAEYDEKEQTQPRNQMRVSSGFEMEVGIEDYGDLTADKQYLYNALQEEVSSALQDRAAEEGITFRVVERKALLDQLRILSRSEYVLLHLILCHEQGQNVAFMEMPRKNMAARIIGHLEAGNLKQSMTDLIYAFEVNTDEPTSLHETVITAQSVEALLTDYYAPNFGVKIVQAPSFQLNLSMWVKAHGGGEINTACPARQYLDLPDGSKKLQSVQYTEFYTHLLQEVNRELSKLITEEVTGVFRCSKLVTHIDWKVYPLEERQGSVLASMASSPYAQHRHDTGKSASIRVVGGDMKDSRFEIRLFGPNVHAEAQMPNRETVNENLFKQSDLLAIVAERVLIAVDRVNCREVYEAARLSAVCDGYGKPFGGRARGLSSASGSVKSGSTDVTGGSWADQYDLEGGQIGEVRMKGSEICHVM